MKDYLHALVSDVLDAAGIAREGVEIQFEKPRQPEHGDLSTNIAMMVARVAKTNPRQLAQDLCARMDERVDRARIEAIEIAGPGFINFRFTTAHVHDELARILKLRGDYGRSDAGAGRTVNVEWVSANPTGPLHAGHGRQVCIGAILCTALEWAGWKVTREYYFNNAGSQMHNLAVTVRERYLELLGDAPVEENIHYVGDYVREVARGIVETHGDSRRDAALDFFRSQGEQWCFASIRATLERLGVQHDIFFNEDSLYRDGKIDEVLTALRAKDLVYDKDDAVWLRATAFGADKDRVIVKSTGEPTYRLPDIAYHREKVLRDYDQIIDIFGADHIATIPDVLAGVGAMDLRTDHIKVIIHQMVSFVSGGETVKMSKRSGNVYFLEDLIDDVGVDAVRYFFVMRGAGTHLDFDVALAKEQSENNPVYYLQYAHARIASIIRFAESEGFVIDADAPLHLLAHEAEISLIKALSDFPQIVAGVAASHELQHLCTYLHATAAAFHKFYHECRVVTDDRALSTARLALCVAARQVIANGCTILGIKAPERM